VGLQPFREVWLNLHKSATRTLCIFGGDFDQVGFKIDFRPIEALQFRPTQTGECAKRNVRHHIRRRVLKQTYSFIDREDADRRLDRFRSGSFSGWIVCALVTVPGKIEGHDQHAAEIISRNRGKPFPAFFITQAAQPFVHFRRADFRNRLAVETFGKLIEAAAQIAQITSASTVGLFDFQKLIDQLRSCAAALHGLQMRNIKFHRVTEACAKWLQCFGALQVLSATPFVKRNAGDSVVFLLG